ncbi:hypothetical protein ACUXP6_002098 [Staphylococcus cohnii]|nr:hypothetical protein [Staphylococcus cohnii]
MAKLDRNSIWMKLREVFGLETKYPLKEENEVTAVLVLEKLVDILDAFG